MQLIASGNKTNKEQINLPKEDFGSIPNHDKAQAVQNRKVIANKNKTIYANI